VYAYGTICALTVDALWQLWPLTQATTSLPHSLSLVASLDSPSFESFDGIKWAKKDDTEFPPYAAVLPVILRCLIASIVTAIGSMLIFGIIRFLVLRSENGLKLAYYVLPPAVFITAWINMYFVFTKVSSTMCFVASTSYCCIACVRLHTRKHTVDTHTNMLCTATHASTLLILTQTCPVLQHTNTQQQVANKTIKWTENKAQWVAALIALAASTIAAFAVMLLIKSKAVRDMKADVTLHLRLLQVAQRLYSDR
jgi:Phosphate transporter family